jgi:PAS domain S-box-containing protein
LQTKEIPLSSQPTYEELEQRILELEKKKSIHRKITRELQDSEERFRALSDATFGGVIIHDQGLILDCNQGLSDLTGFTIEELVGMNGLDLIAPDSLAQVLENIKSGYEQRYEVEGVRKDGSIYDLAIKGKNTPYKGQEVRVIEFLDITERIQAEKEKAKLEDRLQQAQKMEAIGTLAGGIAHDFNNILAVILGYADLAKEDAPPGTSFNKDIDQILIAANRAKNLVKQILDFGRQTQAVRYPIKVQPLVKEGLKMLRSSIPSTISMTENIDMDCGAILADPTQVHQILMNLCTNAYQAMEATGGILSVTLKETTIETDDKSLPPFLASGQYVKLTVSDTGEGISPDVLDKIFEPYFTTKDIGKGTGMGLAIIHGIMQHYDGDITVESQLGEGSIFHVYFPLVAQEVLSEIEKHQNIPLGSERILLVDDEVLLCEMGQDLLGRLGYKVTMQCSSLEALAAFEKTPDAFDLVLTDQTMPDLTGSELAEKILQIRPGIPIILCTGYSNLIDQESAKAIGIKEFALKPLTNSSIGRLIRKVLDEPS